MGIFGQRVVFSRRGVEFHGVDGVARWVYRVAMPVLRSWPGRIAVAATVLAGVATLILGRPAGPPISHRPWVDFAIGLVLGYALALSQELAHAVTLVHYGGAPRRAGFGFYRGALCIYVDSPDGLALPRRARIINLLAGLALFFVVCSPLLLVAHVSTAVLLTGRVVSGFHPAVARRAVPA